MKLNEMKNNIEETKDMLNINEHKYKYESYNEEIILKTNIITQIKSMMNSKIIC